MNNVFIGKHGPLLIAEIGGNHEGNFEYAKKLTKLAIETNVDYVKFQIYTGDTLVSKIESPQRNEHFKKFELSQDQHVYLAEMVKEAGVGYMSSVWNLDAMRWIDRFISIYKIGSGDLTAYPIVMETAKRGKPIILSTGLSTENEILETVNVIQSTNECYKSKDYLALLQCTSMYPIAPKDANLNVMNKLRNLTNLTVGYSDHTEGLKGLFYSIAMGAEVVEFHFTDSRIGKTFRDHNVSLTPAEVKELIAEIRLIKSYQGVSEKKASDIEIETGHLTTFRRAVYPIKPIKQGEPIGAEDLTVLRPNIGIEAKDYFKLIGKKANIDLQPFQKLSWEYFK